MAPTDNSKCAVLRELALARFPEDAEVANAMRRAEELAVQQTGDPTAFVAATEALLVINQRACSVVGSRQADQEAWALSAAVAAYQKEISWRSRRTRLARRQPCCRLSPSTSPPLSPRPGLS
jgi:hypothetical protein